MHTYSLIAKVSGSYFVFTYLRRNFMSRKRFYRHKTYILITSALLVHNLFRTHKRRPAAPPQPQFQHTVIPWSPSIGYLGLTLDSKLLFTKHLHAVTHKTTGVFLQLFPLLARDSTLYLHTKLSLSLQATDTAHTHLCCPRLEQHTTF